MKVIIESIWDHLRNDFFIYFCYSKIDFGLYYCTNVYAVSFESNSIHCDNCFLDFRFVSSFRFTSNLLSIWFYSQKIEFSINFKVELHLFIALIAHSLDETKATTNSHAHHRQNKNKKKNIVRHCFCCCCCCVCRSSCPEMSLNFFRRRWLPLVPKRKKNSQCERHQRICMTDYDWRACRFS